ncbi:DUF6034 family protein [Clostridium sp. AM58-1XD]|uniref:DUF6034 family protein n=1 Tax=Clostridium sp. AM58-1XD TaxID=2292307 RepID=UPI0011C0E135|nr:DUF6034 family protein [Clostridium sp. AM58-1XD]
MKSMRKKGLRISVILMTGFVISCFTGCIPQTEVPIISEKTGETEGKKIVSEDETPPDNETISGKKQEEEEQEKGLIKDITEAPERYKAEVSGDQIKVTADAYVDIPKVSEAPVIEIEASCYQTEDYTKYLTLLENEIGTLEWTANTGLIKDTKKDTKKDTEGFDVDETSSNGQYHFSFHTGINRNGTPMIWLTNTKLRDGTNGEFDNRDLSGFSLTEEEREKREIELKKRSEELIADFSEGDFRLESGQWKRLSSSESGRWVPSSQYGYRMVYVRSVGEIPVINHRYRSAFSEISAPVQYMEILYTSDGTLLEFKNINKEVVKKNETGTDKKENFLLPFSAVSQIFEQYMKSYYFVHNMKPEYSYPNDESLYSIAAEGMESCVYADVTKVEFGYRLEYDGWDYQTGDKGSGTGRLVPVWSFYGTASIGYVNKDGTDSGSTKGQLSAEQESLLLAVNAGDGTIYGRDDLRISDGVNQEYQKIKRE